MLCTFLVVHFPSVSKHLDNMNNLSHPLITPFIFFSFFDPLFKLVGRLQSLVPLGSVEELLAVYDGKRAEMPPPVTVWEWGWTMSAETWNGRSAMIIFLILLFLEVVTDEGLLHQFGVFPYLRR